LDGDLVEIKMHTSGKAADATCCPGILRHTTLRRQINVPQGCISSKYLDGKVRAAVAEGGTAGMYMRAVALQAQGQHMYCIIAAANFTPPQLPCAA
jgi:hypothetical protein